MTPVKVRVIRVDGTVEQHEVARRSDLLREVAKLIGADVLDSFSLRDGRRVWVDDLGGAKNLPLNREATALYHGICRPGTRHEIVGHVAILPEDV